MQEIIINRRDFDALEVFMERADQTRRADYFLRYKSRSVTLDGVPTKVEVAENLPSESEIFEVIGLFRPFYLQEEDIHYLKINKKLRNICKAINKQDYLEILENHKNHYIKSLQHAPIGIMRFGEEFTPKKILDLYLNGQYAHFELEKSKIIKSLGSLRPIVKLIFITTLDDLIECIHRTANVYFHLKRDNKITILEVPLAA